MAGRIISNPNPSTSLCMASLGASSRGTGHEIEVKLNFIMETGSGKAEIPLPVFLVSNNSRACARGGVTGLTGE